LRRTVVLAFLRVGALRGAAFFAATFAAGFALPFATAGLRFATGFFFAGFFFIPLA